MMALFNYFDVDHNGVITFDDLKQAFGKTGKMIISQEIDNIIQMYGASTKEEGLNLKN